MPDVWDLLYPTPGRGGGEVSKSDLLTWIRIKLALDTCSRCGKIHIEALEVHRSGGDPGLDGWTCEPIRGMVGR